MIDRAIVDLSELSPGSRKSPSFTGHQVKEKYGAARVETMGIPDWVVTYIEFHPSGTLVPVYSMVRGNSSPMPYVRSSTARRVVALSVVTVTGVVSFIKALVTANCSRRRKVNSVNAGDWLRISIRLAPVIVQLPVPGLMSATSISRS